MTFPREFRKVACYKLRDEYFLADDNKNLHSIVVKDTFLESGVKFSFLKPQAV